VIEIFINVHVLVYHIHLKHSLMHGYGTHKVHLLTPNRLNVFIHSKI